MQIKIGAFEAKAKLSALLREVERGKRYTITVRGRPIADLIPSKTFAESDSAIEEMRKIKKIRGVNKKTILEWIAEGRK